MENRNASNYEGSQYTQSKSNIYVGVKCQMSIFKYEAFTCSHNLYIIVINTIWNGKKINQYKYIFNLLSVFIILIFKYTSY